MSPKDMRRFVPHILFLAVLAAVTIVGLLWNVQSIAAFIGSFAAFCTDPLLVLMAVAIGALSRNLLILLMGSVIAGIVFSLYIANFNSPLGAELTTFMTFTRTSAIFTLALVTNAARLFILKDRTVIKG